MDKISLCIEREGTLLSHLGFYKSLDDAKEEAESLGMITEGCEVIAYQGEKMWLLTSDWEDISTDQDEKQPDWQQEWEDFGEVYDDDPERI